MIISVGLFFQIFFLVLMAKRSPSIDISSHPDESKEQDFLVRTDLGWEKKRFKFDPSSGILKIGKDEFSLAFFDLKPSPFRTDSRDSLVFHLSPFDVHFTSVDKKIAMEWSYFLRAWLRDQVFLPPLSSEEAQTASSLLSANDSTVLIDRFGISVSRKMLACLRKAEWLSDEVINFYFSLLGGRKIFSWSTFFWSKLSAHNQYNYSGVRNWGAKRNLALNNLTLMLVPLHIDKAHWALGVVDLQHKTTQYLDSLGPQFELPIFHTFIQQYIWDESGDSSIKFTPIPAPPNLACQENGSDCGVFICLFALALSQGKALSEVAATDVRTMRKRMAIQIARGYL